MKNKAASKNIFGILLLSVIIYSCGTTEPVDSSDSFFPLKVGNTWYYDSNPAQEIGKATKWEIVAKKQFAGNDYYEMIRSFNNSYYDTLYYRTANNKLYRLFIGVNPDSYYYETLYADFNLDANGSFKYYTGDISSKDFYYNVTIKNKTQDEITFFYNSPIAVDEEHSVTFKKGVGISETYSDAWGIHSYLIHRDIK